MRSWSFLYNTGLLNHFKLRLTIHFSDARNNLKSLIDQTIADADVTLITRRDAPNAVIMSQDQYDSMVETMYLLRSPANAGHLARSISQLRRGQIGERDLTEDAE
jgi:antitoxin YefM